jgi:hypothetical protein
VCNTKEAMKIRILIRKHVENSKRLMIKLMLKRECEGNI